MIGRKTMSASQIRLEIIRAYTDLLPDTVKIDFDLAIQDLENAISTEHCAALMATINRHQNSVQIQQALNEDKLPTLEGKK